MSRHNGGPAFPAPNWHDNTPCGMSLRQWYAGMALMGQLAFSPQDSFNKAHEPQDVAAIAWAMADAMLEAPGAA